MAPHSTGGDTHRSARRPRHVSDVRMARGRSAPVGLERARGSALYALSRPGSAAADHRALRASGPPTARPHRDQGRGHRSHLRRTVGRRLGTGRNTGCRDKARRPDRHPAAGMSDVSARDARVPRVRTPVCRTRYALSAGLARSRAAGCAPSADHHAGGWPPRASRPGCQRCASSV